MDEWTITFSPGGLVCTAKWTLLSGATEACGDLIRPGYIIAAHPSFPGEQMCLSCMVATVRHFLRQKQLD